MLKIDHILFPVDCSERCCGAVPFVESMAKRYGARITLLSVAQPFYWAAMGDPGGMVMVDSDALLDDLKGWLDSSLANAFPGLNVERVAELGDPAQVIVEFAHAHGASLIMMPTHGYGPFRSLLLGSVTAKVLYDAECPVWTGAHVAEPPCRDHIAYRNVLCAVDGSANSVALMQWANELSQDAGATLRLVHVIPGMEGLPSRQMDREYQADRRKEAYRAIERLVESAGLKAELCVVSGNVAESVCDEGRRHGADLIVIGRGALHATLGRLRTHAHEIIRQSPCPVLSV